jgi:hypothetical protein
MQVLWVIEEHWEVHWALETKPALWVPMLKMVHYTRGGARREVARLRQSYPIYKFRVRKYVREE